MFSQYNQHQTFKESLNLSSSLIKGLEIRDNLRLDFDEYQHVLDKFNEDEQLDAFGYLNIKIKHINIQKYVM